MDCYQKLQDVPEEGQHRSGEDGPTEDGSGNSCGVTVRLTVAVKLVIGGNGGCDAADEHNPCKYV